MPYVADLNPSNGQVVALRAVDAQGAETPTLKNVSDAQYTAMKNNAQDDRNKYFCSEACAASIGIDDAWRFDPNTFAAAIRRAATIGGA